MDIYSTRLQNLKRLLVGFGGKKKDFAAKLDTEPAYLSQVLSAKAKKRKVIGDDLARRAEQAFGKPHGWMDTRHEEIDEKTMAYIEAFLSLPEPLQEEAIRHLESLKELAGALGLQPGQDTDDDCGVGAESGDQTHLEGKN